jgi:hypothetical protein
MLRKVDRVTVKGSEQPISLFTLDIAEDEANVRAALELDPTAVLSDEARAARRALLQQRIADAHADGDASEAQQQDPSLMQVELDAFEELEAEERMFARTAAVYWLRLATTPEFLDSWQLAQRSYVAGDWGRAKPHFERCRELLPTDGPTATLMAYLERRDWTSPADWTGARAACAAAPQLTRACALVAHRSLALAAAPDRPTLPPRYAHAGVRELTSK